MAKEFEVARASGATSSYSVDEAVGIAVNQLMFLRRLTRKQLGEALGVSGPNAGRKLRGEVTWSMTDLIYAADLLEVDPSILIPRRTKEDPALTNQDGIFNVVAGTGFEPVTSGL